MIIFVNLNSVNPLAAVACMLACVALNLGMDWLASGGPASSGSGSLLWLELAAASLGLLFGTLLVLAAARWLLPQRFVPAGLRQFLAAFGGGGQAAAGAANNNAPRPQAAAQSAQARQQRWDKVVRALQRLPTDTIAASEDELRQLPAHELKARLAAAGCTCEGVVEKDDLVRQLLAAQQASSSSSPDGSSSDRQTCVICCSDYEGGDVVRVLPCKHVFHIECVDRWFLSAASDYSRAPACPLCSAELLLPPS